MKKKAILTKLLSLLLCAVLLTFLLPLCLSVAEGNGEEDTGRPIMVSMGDSYSSGEGIEPFYGQDEPMSSRRYNTDWLAHRSEHSWSGQLKLPGVDGKMSDHRWNPNDPDSSESMNANWYFVASSGAVTDNIKRTSTKVVDKETGRKDGQQQKDYDRDWVWGTEMLNGQLDVFYNTPGLDRNDVDYVTISIGGNDVGFVDIVSKAANPFANDLYDAIDWQLDHFYDKGGIYYKLRDAYIRIHEAAPNAVIIVAGYPELLSYDGSGVLFNSSESQYIDRAVRVFNKRIESLVNECRRGGMNIYFVSVEGAFKDHQAYTDDPYLNSVDLFANSQDLKANDWVSAYSMHPNATGAEKYAECVQSLIDELEASKDRVIHKRETSKVRNVVLVLDTSGSMRGTPIDETRKAAAKFVETVLKEDAAISIVTYSDYAMLMADFSKEEGYLKEIAESIYADGNTNTDAGLTMASDMLMEEQAEKPIIVLMSDGMANRDRTGSALTEFAQTLKDKGITIYTLGFFESLYGYDKREAQASMEGIASPGHHYEVENVDSLVFVFNDVADQINGAKYVYIRIACPVDVEVTYQGETLSSVTGNTRTSFGSLTFEEGEGSASGSSDNRTKVLRLRDGADYQVMINGNGEGNMNYTAGFVDSDGNYSDLREIKDVPITRETRVKANASRRQATTLRVDSDGDGRYDQTYTVKGRQGGVSSTVVALILFAVLALMITGGALISLKQSGKAAFFRVYNSDQRPPWDRQ